MNKNYNLQKPNKKKNAYAKYITDNKEPYILKSNLKLLSTPHGGNYHWWRKQAEKLPAELVIAAMVGVASVVEGTHIYPSF